jgi:hypothetical protein
VCKKDKETKREKYTRIDEEKYDIKYIINACAPTCKCKN